MKRMLFSIVASWLFAFAIGFTMGYEDTNAREAQLQGAAKDLIRRLETLQKREDEVDRLLDALQGRNPDPLIRVVDPAKVPRRPFGCPPPYCLPSHPVIPPPQAPQTKMKAYQVINDLLVAADRINRSEEANPFDLLSVLTAAQQIAQRIAMEELTAIVQAPIKSPEDQ